jgi:hypothetical protein
MLIKLKCLCGCSIAISADDNGWVISEAIRWHEDHQELIHYFIVKDVNHVRNEE